MEESAFQAAFLRVCGQKRTRNQLESPVRGSKKLQLSAPGRSDSGPLGESLMLESSLSFA